MNIASKSLDFESAIKFREEIARLKKGKSEIDEAVKN